MSKNIDNKTQNKTVYIPQANKEQSQEQNADAANYVLVALCHPHGITFSLSNNVKVTLNGNATDLQGQETGTLPLGGYGLTRILESQWEEIKSTYGTMQIFKNGLIFAHNKKENTLAECNEKAELRHGQEPIVTDGKAKNSVTQNFDGSK